ncbi:MAG: bifunctional folylpolyglutamate synthase/dihydrofolate synthase [Lachnospiraceae bacterium]|nr:bifunctional folylpolyglutamate synthase/dihydrofolate synthase [Lachnospiraceae bacterium]
MKYTEAVEYMESLSSYGIVPGLGNIRNLCEKLKNPQKDLKFVHIAGTNGKGSVLAYVSTILKAAGYKVGRYVSPTIFEYRERIQVNNRSITKKALGEYVERMKEICGELVAEGKPHPTPFEVETAMAFLFFKEQGCDIVVMETGMGGRQDATNIIENTLIAVLVSVSMDHMQFLGKDVTAIAAEKAGIIKPGYQVVTALQEPEVMQVIEKQAEEYQVPVTVATKKSVCKIRYGLEKQRFDYGSWKNLEISLAGKHQIGNAVLAIEVVQALQQKGYEITEKALRAGLKETQWPGRFTLLAKKPYFVVDGAHNEDASKKLAESIEFYFTNKRIIYIMGILRDKEYEKIIDLTHGYADQILTVATPNQARTLSSYELATEVAKVHQNVTAVDSLEEAVEIAYLLAGKEDVIIAFGSLSFTGKLMNILEKRKA